MCFLIYAIKLCFLSAHWHLRTGEKRQISVQTFVLQKSTTRCLAWEKTRGTAVENTKNEDYVTAEAGTPEWYEQDANYAYAIMDWNAALNEYVYTGTSPSQQILVNQNSISGNGKYMVMSTPDDARRYNTEDGTFIALPGTSGQVTTGITNNGDVLMASPIG